MAESFNYDELRKRMKTLGYTQNDLAKEASIGRTSMNLKLNNKAVFTQTDIRNICGILNIDDDKVGFYFFTPLVQFSEHLID